MPVNFPDSWPRTVGSDMRWDNLSITHDAYLPRLEQRSQARADGSHPEAWRRDRHHTKLLAKEWKREITWSERLVSRPPSQKQK